MTLPSTRTIPRPEGSTQAAVVFAGEQLNIARDRDRNRLDGAIKMDRLLGRKSWSHFENIGEIHYALTRAAKIAGYAKLKAVRWSPDHKEIETEIEGGFPADVVARIYSRIGGLRGLIERFYLQQKICGESHMIRFRENREADVDGLQFVTSREIDTGTTQQSGLSIETSARQNPDGITWTTIPKSVGGTTVGDAFVQRIYAKDYVGRVWQPSPSYIDVPESPLFALGTQCDLLHDMTTMMAATMKSRFATGGILFFPNSIRDVMQGNIKSGEDKTFLDAVYEILKHNVQMSDSSTSILPILVQGEDEAGKLIQHILLDRQIMETDIRLRAELIDRILFGLDIVAPATKSGEDLNHFGAWQASADEVRLAVVPDVEGFCWIMERMFMRQALLDEQTDIRGDDVARIGVWYDLSQASVRANRQQDAKVQNELGLLGDIPTLEAGGWGADDQLKGDAYVRWVGRTRNVPRLALWGTPEYDKIPWDEITPTKQPGPAPGADDAPDKGSPDGEDTDRPESDKPV